MSESQSEVHKIDEEEQAVKYIPAIRKVLLRVFTHLNHLEREEEHLRQEAADVADQDNCPIVVENLCDEWYCISNHEYQPKIKVVFEGGAVELVIDYVPNNLHILDVCFCLVENFAHQFGDFEVPNLCFPDVLIIH